MASTRPQKVARVIKEELSRIFREEMNDPRLGFMSITDVNVSPDLRVVHVYVSVYGSEQECTDTMAALTHARGFLRSTLGKAIDLRHTPELNFHLDRSIERGARIFELLKGIDIPEGEETPDE